MELRAYLRTLMSKWWIVLITFLITYGATLAFTFTQQPVYQGRATYVVKLNNSFSSDKNLADAVDILSRRTEIATTYTIVANSQQLKRMASEALTLTPEQRDDVSVSSQLVPGTNVVEITVQSHDQVLARDFTNAIGTKLVSYTRGLYETYTLELLDGAALPDTPVKPNRPLNLMLGGVMGVLLGAGMAFLAAYLRAPAERIGNVGILDEETGVYNQQYFLTRMRQELSRAKHNSHPVSVALLNVDHWGALRDAPAPIRREALRKVALRIAPQLRDEDILAHYDDHVFALLLPDMSGEATKELAERLQVVVASSPVEIERSGVSFDLRCCAGIRSYSSSDADSHVDLGELLSQATQALRRAESSTYGKACLFPEAEEYPGAPDLRSAVGV